jgi:hypothetical protein
MQDADGTSSPGDWIGERVTIDLRPYGADDFEKISGTLLYVGPYGVTTSVPYEGRTIPNEEPPKVHAFYPWTSIKSVTHQQHLHQQHFRE